MTPGSNRVRSSTCGCRSCRGRPHPKRNPAGARPDCFERAAVQRDTVVVDDGPGPDARLILAIRPAVVTTKTRSVSTSVATWKPASSGSPARSMYGSTEESPGPPGPRTTPLGLSDVSTTRVRNAWCDDEEFVEDAGPARVPTRVVRPRDVHFVATHPGGDSSRCAREHPITTRAGARRLVPFATEPVQLLGVDVSDASWRSTASRVDDQQRLARLAANDDGDARAERRERGEDSVGATPTQASATTRDAPA